MCVCVRDAHANINAHIGTGSVTSTTICKQSGSIRLGYPMTYTSTVTCGFPNVPAVRVTHAARVAPAMGNLATYGLRFMGDPAVNKPWIFDGPDLQLFMVTLGVVY